MPEHPILSPDDPLLLPYLNLKDKELARDGRRFIAEGEQVVRRLLRSGLAVESVLLATRKRLALLPVIPGNVPALCASDDLIEKIIGFEFHSGVLACGVRPASPGLDIIPPSPAPVLLTIAQQITNTQNLGALIRISAALGAHAVVLGERCCDPYFRQSIRVSMGAIFSLPIIRSEELIADLRALRSGHGVECYATVLDRDADGLSEKIFPSRLAAVFGSEAQGLDAATVAACTSRITIPMHHNVDSLNITHAAAIFLYQLAAAAHIGPQ